MKHMKKFENIDWEEDYEEEESKKVYKSNEQGTCPVCNSDNLDYGGMEIAALGNHIFYPYTCGDCKFEGKEYYRLNFLSHSDCFDKDIDEGDVINTDSFE